jgi:hypothetical protein
LPSFPPFKSKKKSVELVPGRVVQLQLLPPAYDPPTVMIPVGWSTKGHATDIVRVAASVEDGYERTSMTMPGIELVIGAPANMNGDAPSFQNTTCTTVVV